MDSAPALSIVIASWNRRDDLLQTIRDVRDGDFRELEIIAVDNGSTDGTAEAILASFPDVKLVRLAENRGATGGRNAGLVLARAEVILCLDSDASPAPGTLRRIVQAFRADPLLGALNSRVLNASTREFDPAAGWAYSEAQKRNSGREFYTHTFSETGCALRRSALERSGLFWEKLFFGREGEDLALRILDAGYRILYCPASLVLHRASPHKRIASAERRYYDFRNALYIYLVRYPWWMLWMLPLKVAAECVKGLRQRRFDWIGRALRDSLRELPSLLRERSPIQTRTARIYLRFQREQGMLSWNLWNWMKTKTGQP